jgi:hypothetical protein
VSDQLTSLESEIEQTRQHLAATIDQLVYRTSPKTIARRQVAQIRGYFVDPDGAPRPQNIAKVAGGAVGAVLVFVLVRKVVR